jgi:hypothetical protein
MPNMRNVRLKERYSDLFIRGQKLTVIRETEEGLYVKGHALLSANWREEIVTGPISPQLVEEVEPEPPKRTLEEKIREVWP